MNILVTGGAGFIGSNLVRLLVKEHGHDVLNVDALTYAGNRHSLADLDGDPRHRFVQADICDASEMRRLLKHFSPDWIIHLAAESHVDRSIDAPADFVRTNIMGTYVLLEAALDHYQALGAPEQTRFRFLHVSTDEVYGSLGPEDRFTERTPYAPRSPYSASKAAADHLVRAWFVTYKLPSLITNCSNNYGPCQHPEKLIPLVIIKALQDQPIPIYGTGLQTRDWLHVEDHAAGIYTVLLKGMPGETYNIGGNNEQRNIDVATLLCRLLDEQCPRRDGNSYARQLTHVADRPGHDERYAIDAAKILRELGWHPKTDWVSGLRETVTWYLKNETWWRPTLEDKDRLKRRGLARTPNISDAALPALDPASDDK